MMGMWMPETCREEKLINILNGIVHLVGLIYEGDTAGFTKNALEIPIIIRVL